MKGSKGKMDIDFAETYDQEDDIYYVTFKTGEPSYCLEVDDVLLLEVGVFSNLPTGFRILNFNKNKVKSVKIGVMIKKIRKTLDDTMKDSPGVTLQSREERIKRALEGVLN